MTPIVIAFTPNYLVPAATTLKSVLASSAENARFEVICLVTEDIPDSQRRMLERLADGKMVFRYVNCAEKLKGVYVDPRYSEAASYRLLLPEILSDYGKVIYLDCDIIVRNNLAELFDSIDLAGNLLAAIFEAPIEKQAERWKAIGCNPKAYFNSGFLVMNLNQMRKENTSAKFLDELKVDYLEFPDQDVLNKVCQGRVMPLPPIYNSIRTFFIPKYKKDFLKQYSEKDWEHVQGHGTIHYTGGKPWNIFSVRFNDWWDVYETLPADVKSEWTENKKLHSLYRFNKSSIGGSVIRFMQNVKRALAR